MFTTAEEAELGAIDAKKVEEMEKGYLDLERDEADVDEAAHADKSVDVVLSDMSEPWEQTSGFWKKTISNPYRRLMNTSGNNFRDHTGSMVCLSTS